MNILMIGPGSDEKGGIATVMKNFALFQSQTPQPVTISFLTSWKKDQRGVTFWQTFRQLRKRTQQEEFDVVHFHVAQKGSFYRKAVLAWIVPRHIKVIFHMHASQFDSFYHQASTVEKHLIRRLFSRVDRVVALSQQWQTFYQEITNKPIQVIPNAVPVPSDYCYQAESKKVITLGKVGTRKGSADLIEVAKQLPELSFYVYGDGEVAAFRLLAEKQCVKNLHFMGWIDSDEKAALFSEAALHFLPSYQEGLPMAILESMSFGIPNVSTTIGGIPQVINEKNGFLVEPGNVEEMVRALKEFFASTEKRRQLSEQARQMIEENFSLTMYFNQWQQLYAEITGGNKDD